MVIDDHAACCSGDGPRMAPGRRQPACPGHVYGGLPSYGDGGVPRAIVRVQLPHVSWPCKANLHGALHAASSKLPPAPTLPTSSTPTYAFFCTTAMPGLRASGLCAAQPMDAKPTYPHCPTATTSAAIKNSKYMRILHPHTHTLSSSHSEARRSRSAPEPCGPHAPPHCRHPLA